MGLQYRTSYRASGEKAAINRMVLSQKPLAGYPVTTDMAMDIVVSK